jgi:hypothetical protein
MVVRQARYSQEEFARRGQEIYDLYVRSIIRPEDEGKFVAIDIESTSYEIDRDDYAVTEHLLSHCPDAQIWLVRVGQPATYRIADVSLCD